MLSRHQSEAFSLTSYDWWKILRTGLLALAAFVITWVIETLLPDLQDKGILTAAVVAVLIPILDAIRRFLTDHKKPIVLLLVGFLSLAGSVAMAQENSILVVAKSGYYVLESDSAGMPTLVPVAQRFKQVIVLGDPDPSPVPPLPAPDTLTPRGAAVRAAAIRATSDPKREETAVKLATLYTEVAKKIRAGEVKGLDAIAFVSRTGADMLIGTNVTAWQPFRDVLTGQFTTAAQDGAKDTDYAKLLDEVSAGLSASINRQQFGALDLKTILELIKLILDMISKLPLQKGGGL